MDHLCCLRDFNLALKGRACAASVGAILYNGFLKFGVRTNVQQLFFLMVIHRITDKNKTISTVPRFENLCSGYVNLISVTIQKHWLRWLGRALRISFQRRSYTHSFLTPGQ